MRYEPRAEPGASTGAGQEVRRGLVVRDRRPGAAKEDGSAGCGVQPSALPGALPATQSPKRLPKSNEWQPVRPWFPAGQREDQGRAQAPERRIREEM